MVMRKVALMLLLAMIHKRMLETAVGLRHNVAKTLSATTAAAMMKLPMNSSGLVTITLATCEAPPTIDGMAIGQPLLGGVEPNCAIRALGEEARPSP